MGEQEVAGIFSRAAVSYDHVGPQVFAHFGRRLVECACVGRGARVLDVATGRGASLFPAARAGGPTGRAVGVDLSAGMMRELARDLRDLAQTQLAACQMDAGRLAWAGESFDFVFCGNSIYYFPEAVHEFHRVLRPGGCLGVSILARGCLDWIFEEAAASRGQAAPEATAPDVALDTPGGLAALLRGAGFAPVRVLEEEAEFVYADEAVWWAMLWSLGLRGALEAMTAEQLETFRRGVLGRLQPGAQSDGFHVPFRLLFALGSR